MGIVKYFDVETKKLVDVTVDEEVSCFIKRSYWREDMQERRYVARTEDLLEEVKYDVQDEIPTTLDILIHNEEVVFLRESVSRLCQRERSAIYLRYWGGLSIQGIAVRLGVSESYASKIIHKALVKLKESYTKEF